MTDIVKITPNALAPLGTSPGHLVAVLAYDGVSAFELGIAVEIFGLPGMGVDWYRVRVCAEHPESCSWRMAASVSSRAWGSRL
jgi:AraC family transcriptional regulator, transcriptional activator FtrA